TANREGALSIFDLVRDEQPTLDQRLPSVTEGARVTTMKLLAGGISLMIGSSDGRISQWFPVRDESGKFVFTRIRDFDSQSAPIVSLAPEFYRKGFLAADSSGQLGIYHATAHRTLLLEKVASTRLAQLAVAPRANAMLGEDSDGNIHFLHIDNKHPEISFSSLWGKVWYENYDEPAYVWQSSSASDSFEPKLSLTPVTFGTLKAAFYAMLVALPLAILGAIYTAQFMAPRMRRIVKPTIEIMEALPTVIIGFLAGLWLAPVLETHLPGMFALLLVLPLGILLFAFIWTRLVPDSIRHMIPDNWEAALLLPVVALLSWFSFGTSPLLERLLFGGDMIHWLTHEMGIPFDQRNSLVVGIAMGFAVIPTIFSMAEDALFGVPKHLIRGSLALGATPWQTLTRVVLLTASPGIFAAVMIGLGRAVGETMIVLMATGNTPVMDLSIFQGMRTLSANIAVEMPEAEVASTHYRVLFLAALVLFTLTFLFNTLAEMVRQRLRKKYSNL
ncbi:MAG TPA: ABC transporter permease subunit, partial [Gammaproteobacteria bacterium]|nr:ABC transporter permease subunit [Gammaproteobacteria bacterium]